MSSVDIFASSLFRTIGLVTTLSTLYDVLSEHLKIQRNVVFLTFSIVDNFKHLVKISESKSIIRSIDCMKLFATFWVVFGHRKITSQPTNSWGELLVIIKSHIELAIDTFIPCSGILVCQSLLRCWDRNDFNPLKLYVNRFVRFFAVMSVAVVFTLSTIPDNYSDVKKAYDDARAHCRNRWNSTLLLYQNYNDVVNNNCLAHLWYLALDFQLFLLAPVIVFGLKKCYKETLATCCIFGAAFHLAAMFILNNDPMNWYIYYMKTQFRLTQYLTGMVFGSIMYNARNSIDQISMKTRTISYIGWILSILVFYYHFHDGIDPQASGKMFQGYDLTYRWLWSLAICWVAFACHQHETGGIIRKFLSLELWQPFSKIGLSIYVVHFLYFFATNGFLKQKSSFGMWYTFTIHVGDIFVSCVLGTFMYCCVEAPTEKILSILWSKKRRTEKSISSERENLIIHSK